MRNDMRELISTIKTTLLFTAGFALGWHTYLWLFK